MREEKKQRWKVLALGLRQNKRGKQIGTEKVAGRNELKKLPLNEKIDK